MPRRALLTLLVFAGALLCVLGFARSARAEVADDCAAAANALESVSVEDRKFLSTLCRYGDGAANAWRKSSPSEVKRLERLAARLMARSDGEATLLFRLLPAGAFEERSYVVDCGGQPGASPLSTILPRPARAADEQGATQPYLPQGCSVIQKAPETAPPKPITTPPPKPKQKEAPPPKVVPRGSPIVIVAPSDVRVLLVAPDATPSMISLTAQPDDKSNLAVFSAVVPVNSFYAISVGGKLGGDVYPVVYRGNAYVPVMLPDAPIRTGCIDFQMKTDSGAPVITLFDGYPVDTDRDGALHSAMIRVPLRSKKSSHIITVQALGDDPVVLANRRVELDATSTDLCTDLRFDLTTRKSDSSVLLGVDADTCINAGIDQPKLLAYVKSFVEGSGLGVSDLQAWGQTAEYLGRLRQTLDQIGGAPVGGDRERLDSVQNVATGAGELLRQGFSTVLDVALRCSRRGTNWDYSFVARIVDLKTLRGRTRDPLTGIDLSGVQQTAIELITDRRALGPRIEGTLARLLSIPALVIDPLPPELSFIYPIVTSAEAYVPRPRPGAPARSYVAALAVRPLTRLEQTNICSRVDDMHELRGRRDFKAFDRLGGWRAGDGEEVPASGEPEKVLLSVEPHSPGPILLRASLHELNGQKRQVAVGYACVDQSRQSVELWAEIGGWFPFGADPDGRTEVSGAFNLMLGVDYQQRQGWLSLGAGVGYSHMVRLGDAPSTWDGLDGAVPYHIDGSSPYEIRENATYLLFHAQAKASLCQLLFTDWCIATTRRLMLTARVMALPGLHVVDQSLVDDDLVTFKRSGDVRVRGDIGVLAQPGIAIQLTSTLVLNGRMSFGTNRLFDYWTRDASDASVYRHALWGTSLGVAWDL